jgi:hypothetical protein
MVQVLERIPSFGERFAQQFSQGLGRGIETGLSLADRLAGTRARQRASQEKLAGSLSKSVPGYLKNYHPSLEGNPKAMREISSIASEFLRSDPTLSHDEALDLATNAYKEGSKIERPESEPARQSSRGKVGPELKIGEERGIPSQIQAIKDYFRPVGEAIKEKPSLLASELPSALSKLGKSIELDPVKLVLSGLGIGDPNIFEKQLSAGMRKDLPPELEQGAERISDLESALLGLAIPLPKGIGQASKLAGREGLELQQARSIQMANARRQAADELVGGLASKHPGTKFSQAIEKEKPALIGAWEEIDKRVAESTNAIKNSPNAKTEKIAAETARGSLKEIRKSVNDALKKIPILGKYPLVKDVILGAATSALGEFAKEEDIDIPGGASTWASVLLGRGQGAGGRFIGNQLARIAIKKWKKKRIMDAYRNEDDRKISEYKKKYGPKLVKEAREEAFRELD